MYERREGLGERGWVGTGAGGAARTDEAVNVHFAAL